VGLRVDLLIIIFLSLATVILSAWLTRFLCHPAAPFQVLDHPNERSLHEYPTPRGGGLAILIAILVCGAMASLFHPVGGLAEITLSIFVVAIMSFLDDRYSVPPIYRFLAHGIAAAGIIYGGFYLQRLEILGATWHWSNVAGSLFSALFIVWMINLYNFMDGMDGFAGGMAVSGFGVMAVMGWMAEHDAFFAISLIIATASAGFLFFNFPPAKIFMGDVGSSTLGLLAAALSIWGARDGIFPFWVAILIFSPFIFDATVTLLRRLFQGEIVWKPHKSHYYQKLAQAGWGHRKTVLVEYAIMIGCGITALSCVRATATTQMAVLAGWILFYFLFFSWATWYASRRCHNSA
jgi:UDP-N-acetylmuramyl pentapeptide phosphotransferase/UDP-N-acetylglucosamine-1-phosphate transferase